MRMSEAKQPVLAEWRGWLLKHGKGDFNAAFPLFWGWLSANRSQLLKFRCNGDRWQVVKGWLEERRYAI